MSSRNRRPSSLTPTPSEPILSTELVEEPARLPSSHLGSVIPTMPPPPMQSVAQHSRTSSEILYKPNRLSMSFPIARSPTLETARPTPTSSTMSSLPSTPSDATAVSAKDPPSVLVAIASQERKVLELKEELGKAETDLKKLKKQWHAHEATRKRAEIRNAAQLQELTAVVTEGRNSSDDPNIRRSVDLDRRKALLGVMPKETPKRKVFSGGHARALSLLSPERQVFMQPSLGTLQDVQDGPASGIPIQDSSQEPQIRDTSQGMSKISSSRANAKQTIQSGVTYSAKQIADGMKLGLWTFIEDLRQATVGDEGVSGPTKRRSNESLRSKPVKKGSKGSLRGRRGISPHCSTPPRNSLTMSPVSDTQIDSAGSVWPKVHRMSSKSPVVLQIKPMALAPPDDDDGWSNWDSPTSKSPVRWSGSSVSERGPSTPSDRGYGPQAEKCIDDPDKTTMPSKRDSLPWPALEKLAPNGLKRTVPNFMDDWERSLTPQPPEDATIIKQSAIENLD